MLAGEARGPGSCRGWNSPSPALSHPAWALLHGVCAHSAQGAAGELGSGGADTNQHRSCWLLETLGLEAGSWAQGPGPAPLPSRVRGTWAGARRAGTSVRTGRAVQGLVVLQGCLVPVGSRRCMHVPTVGRGAGGTDAAVQVLVQGASLEAAGLPVLLSDHCRQPLGPASGVSGPALEQRQAVPSRGTAVCRGSAGAGSWGRHHWGHGSFPSLCPCPGLCSHARALRAWLFQAL